MVCHASQQPVGARVGAFTELGMTILMRRTLDLFRVALQTEPLIVKQIRHRPRRHRVTCLAEFPWHNDRATKPKHTLIYWQALTEQYWA